MKNQIDDVLNSKIGKKQFLIPLITIIAFVLVIGGVSYAYFGFTSVTNNVIYANVSTPSAVNKSLSITKRDCALTVNMEDMQYGNNSYDPVASSDCGIYLNLEGAAGDYCTYKLFLESVGTPYIPSTTLSEGQYEIKAFLSLVAYSYCDDCSHQSYDYSNEVTTDNIDQLTNIDLAPYNRIHTDEYFYWDSSLGSSNIEVLSKAIHSYGLSIYFYNLAGVDQSGLIKSTTAPTVYKWQLKVTDLECNWNH